MARSSSIRRRGGLARACLGAAGLGIFSALLARLGGAAFALGPAAAGHAARSGLRPLRAESEKAPAPAPSSSSALVAITEETKTTTVGVVGGLVGLLVGGIWVGAATFAAASYFARRDDDIALALKGAAGGALEALNFGADVNEKYEVTGKVSGAVSSAVDSAKANKDTKGAVEALTGAADGVVGAVKSLDKEVGIADTLGKFTTSASDIASQAVDKAVGKASELDKEYKVTDQISKQIGQATGKK